MTPSRDCQYARLHQGRDQLRGIIVPIGTGASSSSSQGGITDEFTVVIILNCQPRGRHGVDGVFDVITLTPSRSGRRPEFGFAIDTQY